MKKRRAVIIIAVAVIGVIFFYFGYIANNYGPQDLSDIRDACINMKEDEECVCTTMDIPPKICRVVKKSPPTEDLVITVENIYTAFPDYDLTPFYEFRRSEEITDVETVMLSNQFYTLERDFPHKNSIVYFTQDGSRVYFVLGEGGEWGCYKLNYLDTLESRYKKTDLDYCPGMVWGTQAENLRPFIIQGGKFFHNDDLYALNLETRKETVILKASALDTSSESWIAGCTESALADDFFHLTDIKVLENRQVAVGVYKKTSGSSKPCTKIEGYPKVREIIVDLKEFQ